MKILFLDHDGVICLQKQWGTSALKQEEFILYSQHKDPDFVINHFYDFPIECRFDNFDKDAVTVLNEILTLTGAKIIVTSDWRKNATLDELGGLYSMHGVSECPIGFTPFFENIEIPIGIVWDFKHIKAQQRALEISAYINNHSEITQWVAVDDYNMDIHYNSSWGLSNFVHAKDQAKGLNEPGLKESILSFLIVEDCSSSI